MMRYCPRWFLPIVLLFSLPSSLNNVQLKPPTLPVGASIPAFPGAEGFGANTPGGRGGRVILVTSLADSGPGTLRACAEAAGPRVCVFRVAGTIEVRSRINVWNPFLTIAGQTAPGGGVTLKNGPENIHAPLGILTHDVVIRYLRLRPGPGGPSPEQYSTVDGLTIVHEIDADHPDEGVYNIVIDHVSFSWATDEVVQTGQDVHDVTIQWSVVAEGLHCSTDPELCSSKGMLIGSNGAQDISIHHNLFAHNVGRNPMVQASGTVDLVNNVMHVPGQIAAVADGTYGPLPLNVVGNWVTAPNGDEQVYGLRVTAANDAEFYLHGNRGPYRTSDSQPEELFVRPEHNARSLIVDDPFAAPEVTTTSAAEALEQVLAGAGATHGLADDGAFFWRRDTVDSRVMADVEANVPRIVEHPSDVGGWPALAAGQPYGDNDADGMADQWEARFGLSPGDGTDHSGDLDFDGYTNLEEFLNGTLPGVTDTGYRLMLPLIVGS